MQILIYAGRLQFRQKPCNFCLQYKKEDYEAKNICLVITFTITICWILRNYETSLWLLEKLYRILRPFLIGCFLILMAAPQKIWLFLILFVVLQRIEGDLPYPKIVGKAVGTNWGCLRQSQRAAVSAVFWA